MQKIMNPIPYGWRDVLRTTMYVGISIGISINPVLAQKKTLDTVDYKSWKRLGIPVLSADGKMAMYSFSNSAEKHLVNIQTGKEIPLTGVNTDVFFQRKIAFQPSETGKPMQTFDPSNLTPPAGYQILQRKYNLSADAKQVLIDLAPTKSETGQHINIKAKPAVGNKAVDLELWVWNDEISERKKKKGRAGKMPPGNAKFVYHIDTKNWTNVTPGKAEVLIAPQNADADVLFITDPKPYYYSLDWKYYNNLDIYAVNVHTGQRKLVAKDSYTQPQFSPNGKHAVIYDQLNKEWKVYDPKMEVFVGFSAQINYPVHDEDYDMPRPAPAYGIAGWINEGNSVLIYDRYDLWVIDLSGKGKPYTLTQNYGRKHQISFKFLGADYLDHIDLNKPMLFRSFNENTKSAGLYRLVPGKRIEKLIDDPAYSVKILDRASEDQSFLFSKESFQKFPDIWWANADFSVQKKLTDANPQQEKFLWGTAKVIEWKNFKGSKNQGLLYLPENYDPKKSYPMIVDFYETHSHELHEYFHPEYSTATINIPSYLSKGYIVFRPDTHFTIGEPGESYYNSVVSGTEELIRRGIADKKRIGLQGHSWSGYAVAYLVTRSNLFTCANAGASVVNMTYNYFAVRENGAPCLFKYEIEQSRMGKTLWEDKDGYIKNSPIFAADKIKTPLLIFHNDKDGAVAFTQGLDLFLAMRRLQKPAWLLNYKGEGHTLSEQPAQQDWTQRMEQFFDHYLNGKAMPEWMKPDIKD
ncbi:Prolyl oligopeptidase family protein [Pedobacter sp. ok626]|uniref:alpha/beta hydrolase family protein n=1 Tax=Pedobacter sp. ok626 TaxID=1761882 RepID=UPI0008869980|nr:prolyl oligopeptidase family serine peptidase [Pedobacter sp. ok626]SDL65141.1 Prolyl oligopeptidase family protein [Pedobacter sp. ok626]